jgi:small subunit ribosomal protein S24e
VRGKLHAYILLVVGFSFLFAGSNTALSPPQARIPTRGFEILLGASAKIRGNVTMEIEIIEEDDNPMLHRTDVRFQLIHEEATPSRLSVRDSLAAKLNKDSSEVVVHRLDTKYGMRKSIGYAKVYESAADAKEVEQEYVLERNKITADAEDEDGSDADAAEEA